MDEIAKIEIINFPFTAKLNEMKNVICAKTSMPLIRIKKEVHSVDPVITDINYRCPQQFTVQTKLDLGAVHDGIYKKISVITGSGVAFDRITGAEKSLTQFKIFLIITKWNNGFLQISIFLPCPSLIPVGFEFLRIQSYRQTSITFSAMHLVETIPVTTKPGGKEQFHSTLTQRSKRSLMKRGHLRQTIGTTNIYSDKI